MLGEILDCCLYCRAVGGCKFESFGWVGIGSMLNVCRYSEAIEILYKENTFDFDSLNDVLKLSLTLLPERMRLIKSVQWK